MSFALLRSGGRPLAALLLFGLVFKLLVLAAALDSDPLAHHATSDVRYYLDQARGGSGAARASEPFHMPPLYPRLLASLPGGTEGASTSVLVLQVLAGVFGLLLAWLAAARRVGPRWALIAPALCLAYGPLSFFETKRLGDSLASVLLLGVVVLAEALPRVKRNEVTPSAASRSSQAGTSVKGASWRGALLGASLSLAALLRPQALLLTPLLALWTWKRVGRAPALALALGALLVLLPSTLHNVSAGAGLVPVSDNGPINLWLAHEGPPSGTFVTARPEFGSIHSQAQVAKRAAEQAAGHALTWAEVSAHWRSEALALLVTEPLDVLERIGLRGAALVESFQTGIVSVPEVERLLIPPLRMAALPFGVLLGLAAGLWLALRDPARAGAATKPAKDAAHDTGPHPGNDAPSCVPAWLLSFTVIVSTLMFFHYERFRLPLIPLLAVAVAVGVARWREQRPRAGFVLAGALVALLLAAQSFLPRGHHAHVRANGWSSVAEARLAQLNPGDVHGLADVEAEFATALEADPHYPRALLGHARCALLRGDRSEALRRVEHAEALVPGWDELSALRRLAEGG
ncbi:MAG: hypothetical protein DHS20C15_22160 [Planctomycetota bacterium]|nr:MAG: hypothetical protein DHS20C15_22160 [Planctomycetota bacterium]